MSETEQLLKLIEVTNERLTDLQKSYRVLNECHHSLEMEFSVLKAQITLICQVIKFFISPAVALLLVAEIASLAGVGR